MKKIAILAMVMLMTVGIAYGALTCTFDQTATTAGTSSTYIRGAAQNLSVTLSGWDGTEDNTSTAVISVSGGTITGALTYNSTTNNTYMNTTVNTVALRDDTSYTFTMTIKNQTDQNTLATCTRAFIADNTVPVVNTPSPATASSQSDHTQVLFSTTCTNSSSATLYLDGVTYTMTESSDSCTYTKDYVATGGHSWYVIGSDGLNTTTSSTYTLTIKDQPGGLSSSNTGVGGTTTTTSNGGNFTTIAIIVLAVLMLSKGKKKGGKRRRK